MPSTERNTVSRKVDAVAVVLLPLFSTSTLDSLFVFFSAYHHCLLQEVSATNFLTLPYLMG
jgi:hypothetical protein